jgi:hypothetical protein
VAFGLRDVGDLPKVEGELPLPEVLPEAVVLEAAAPEVAVALTDGQAQTEQDPGPGGADVAPRR